jgi:diguanylate cyclase (GGDEF)-like protein/PAS domain S-box-containing protein
MQSRHRRFHAEWLALAALLLVVAAFLGWTLYRDHTSTEAVEGDRLQVQARVIDENLIRQLEGAYKALGGISDESKSLAPARVDSSLTRELKLLTDAMPGISAMLVLNADGTIVASSREGLLGKNFRQREYFEAPRKGADPDKLYVSPPFVTTLNNYIVVVSRALTDHNGQFVGVVTATLDPDYFNVVLKSVLYAPDMRTTLIHDDGQIFLNVPVNGAALGTDLTAQDSFFSRHQRAHAVSTLAIGKSRTTGDERMIALRTIDRADLHIDRPMVASAGRTLEAIYAPWRARAWQLGALFSVLAIGSSIALWLNHRRRRAFGLIAEAVVRERQVGAERVELALRGANLGLWDLHVPSDSFVVNARERSLLGFTPDEALSGAGAWRELIHPDDRTRVAASILPHLQGHAATYACELRMLHRDGHYVWLSNHAMIVERDASGAPLRIVGTHLDITERKRTEERLQTSAALLRESEEELRLLTDNMPALVSRLDLEQRFRFVNRAYGDWLQIDSSSLIGKSLVEVYGQKAYDSFSTQIDSALAGRKVAYEREMQTQGGTRRVAFTLVPQTGQDGNVKGFYALAIDITARHEAEQQQARSEERLSFALEGSSLALFDWDIVSGMMYHSAQAAAMRGDSAIASMTAATDLQSHVHPEDLEGMLTQLAQAVTGRSPLYHAEFRLRRNTGDWLWVRARGRVVQRDAAGRALRLAGTYADINDRKIAEGKLRRRAEFDSLTGLPNRAVFQERLQDAMMRAASGKPMALLFLDIDHFKTINDTLGHDAGDQLLKIYAGRMQAIVRQSDTVARLAGDEFTIILEAVRDLGDAKAIAAKLVEALRAPIDLAGRQLEVTASIGLALCTGGDTDDVGLLRRADQALYEAKRRGRNGYSCDALTSAGIDALS